VLNVNTAKMIIFDEFDEMLSKGFGESIQELLTYTNTDTRLILSSETVYREITEFISKFLINPLIVIQKPEELSLDCVRQYYTCIDEDLKSETLMKVLKSVQYSQAVIYCNKASTADTILEVLKKNNFPVAVLNLDSEGKVVNNCLKEFKASLFRILVLAGLVLRDIHVFRGLIIFSGLEKSVDWEEVLL
jgi:superfamily II DNA/RNA helicase